MLPPGKLDVSVRRVPQGDNSRTNQRTIALWHQAWPEEALASVAKYFLSGQSGLGIEPFVAPLGAMAVGIHRAVERETAR